ncbi:MAG: phosphopantetheine adenylyltransferase, partial [Burkholderiales bacterium PBB4]
MNAHHWTEWLIRSAFAAVGGIHLLPLMGLLGRPMLERAYGDNLGQGQDLVILMQHRALLFGLLAAACLWAVVAPAWRVPVGVAGLISMAGVVVI